MHNNHRYDWILWAMLLPPLLWFAVLLAQATEQAHGLGEMTALLAVLLNDPLSVRWCARTPKFLLAVLILYPLAVYCYLLDQRDRYPGEEHGSARWGSAYQLNRKYRNARNRKKTSSSEKTSC